MEEIKENEFEYRRFVLLNEANKNNLDELCNTKNITREDLILVLKTIKLNENIQGL